MKVLIIDDNPMIRRTLNVCLKSLGHSVIEAITGHEGIGKHN